MARNSRQAVIAMMTTKRVTSHGRRWAVTQVRTSRQCASFGWVGRGAAAPAAVGTVRGLMPSAAESRERRSWERSFLTLMYPALVQLVKTWFYRRDALLCDCRFRPLP